jgi:hypothetical protein
MGLFSRLRGRCFCAYCKAERRVYVKKHVGLTNVLAASAFAMAITYSQWGVPDPRGLVIFCVFIVGAEVFVYSRWRASMICKLCGFDPLIYKRSPEQAAQKVRQFFDERQQDPKFQMSRSPLLEIQRQRSNQERKSKERSALETKIQARRNSPVLAPSKNV